MKLKSAKIKNFKLLRDIRIEFSDNPQRPLTVVRAENGSGKTSTLMAMRWGLYGDKGLSDPAMRLSPTSWPSGQECEISVQLDFSHTLYSVIAGESVGTTTDYRLVRSAIEQPEGNRSNRRPDRTSLYKYGDGGLEKEDAPDLRIGDMLPREMKDIFFTDGDAALTFVSPQLARSTKSNQVREAIRSLLGLGLLENAGDHIGGARKRFNSGVSKLSGAGELADITRRLEDADDGLLHGKERLRDVERQIEDLARRHEEADKHLQVALQAGNYEELVQEQNRARAQLAVAKDNESPLKQRHQQLLQSERFSLVALGSALEGGFGELAKLHDAGIIPSGSVPVIEERLELELCICETPLTKGSDARRHVEHLIASQRAVDGKRKVLTELHHATKVDLQRGVNAASEWLAEVVSLEQTRLNNRKAMTNADNQLRICGEKIRRVDKVKVAEARKDRDSLLTSLTAKQDERRDLQTDIDRFQSTIDELGPRQTVLRRQDQKLDELNSRLTVTEDMAAIVRGSLEELQQIYLGRVSERMNVMFLDMVGADPKGMAELGDADDRRRASKVIVGAAITSNYEIVVYSNDKTTLNPDHELSGAQKRALTFSFIWALTEISQVIAPRIIDTPLGMMSGLVKRRVIELITMPAQQATDVEKQVVLFLTRDEIRGIESVIAARAGRVMTFTNSDQFPSDVVNDPGIDIPEILQCECDDHQYCRICGRRNDDEYGLVERQII